jgi:acyl-CoA synthetase (AMP-forming)/AMP-acid ligase II
MSFFTRCNQPRGDHLAVRELRDGGNDVMLHALPLYYCAQLDCFLGRAIYLGISNVIIGQPRPDTILPMIEKHAITSFFAPPSVWIALLRSPHFDSTNLSSRLRATMALRSFLEIADIGFAELGKAIFENAGSASW